MLLFGLGIIFLVTNLISVGSQGYRFPVIAGGSPAKNRNQTHLGEFPFMAALGWIHKERGIEFLCGGMVISSKMILTAAHCVCKNGKIPDVVFLGGEPLTEYKKFANLSYNVNRALIYPEYDPNLAYHDIAVLEINNHRNGYQGFRSISLWKGEDLANKDPIAIGYGLTEFAGRDSKQLLKVDLKFFSAEFCEPFYQRQKKFKSGISSAHLCAGDKNGIKDTCQGDSGGPLIIKHRSQLYAVGITSSGQACSGFPPGIYTTISAYIEWISSIFKGHVEHLLKCY